MDRYNVAISSVIRGDWVVARMLVAGVLALGLGFWAMKNLVAPSVPGVEGNSQIEEVKEDIDQAVEQELQRAKDLGQ